MSNLNDLKNAINNPPQNSIRDNNDRLDQEQSDYDSFNDSIQNSQPQEILKPKSTYDQGEYNVPVEIKTPESSLGNANFEQSNEDYSYTNFGQQTQEIQPQETDIIQNQAFSQMTSTEKSFDNGYETSEFVPPIIPLQASIDYTEDAHIQKPKKLNYFVEFGAFLRPLLTLENLIFLVVCIAAFRIRLSFFPFISGDYGTFLKPWMEKIENEGFAAFKEAFYNYTPLYIYILGLGAALKVNSLFWVKIVSVFYGHYFGYKV